MITEELADTLNYYSHVLNMAKELNARCIVVPPEEDCKGRILIYFDDYRSEHIFPTVSAALHYLMGRHDAIDERRI